MLFTNTYTRKHTHTLVLERKSAISASDILSANGMKNWTLGIWYNPIKSITKKPLLVRMLFVISVRIFAVQEIIAENGAKFIVEF